MIFTSLVMESISLWPSERDGYMHLYRYRLDGTLVNQVTKGRWALAKCRWRRVLGAARRWWVSMKRTIGFISRRSNSRRLKDNLYRAHADGSGMMRISNEPGTASHLDVARRAIFPSNT